MDCASISSTQPHNGTQLISGTEAAALASEFVDPEQSRHPSLFAVPNSSRTAPIRKTVLVRHSHAEVNAQKQGILEQEQLKFL